MYVHTIFPKKKKKEEKLFIPQCIQRLMRLIEFLPLYVRMLTGRRTCQKKAESNI